MVNSLPDYHYAYGDLHTPQGWYSTFERAQERALQAAQGIQGRLEYQILLGDDHTGYHPTPQQAETAVREMFGIKPTQPLPNNVIHKVRVNYLH